MTPEQKWEKLKQFIQKELDEALTLSMSDDDWEKYITLKSIQRKMELYDR